MLLLQCRNPTSPPKPCGLVPNVKMSLLVFLGLLGVSAAMPFQMPMPRMPGFSSKSEEMMRYNQFNFMNAPPMMPMGPYGNGMPMPPHMPPQYPPYQMPMWPPPVPNGWQQPPMPNFPSKTDQTQETAKPNQTNPQEPQPQKQPLKEPPNEAARAKDDAQPPQPFPPFGNGLYPYPQPPWPIPQRGPPTAFGRPKFSNEEGNPYYAFFGYHGFGGRPYYSEEMFEDYEKPKEKDPPKPEDPPPDDPPPEASTNSTVPDANATQSIPEGGNDTSPIGNTGPGPNAGNNPTVQNGVFPPPKVNVSGQGVPKSQIPWRPSQPNIYENYPYPNYPSERQWQTTGTQGPRQNGPGYRNPQVERGPQWNSFAWEGKQATRPGNPTYGKPPSPTSGVNYAGNPVHFGRNLPGPNKPFVGANPASNKPFVGANPASNKPFVGANPASNKPFVGANPASNKPFVGANPASNKPYVGANPASNKPFIGANPAANKPSIGTNPAANKPSIGTNPAANKPFVRNNVGANKPFVGTNPSSNQPFLRSNQASNKPFMRSNQASNKPFVGTNVASVGPKQVTVSHNMKTQNPKEKSLGQKERTVTPTKDASNPWRSAKQYGINNPNYNLPRSEGSMVGPNFNSFDQQENSYFSKGASKRVPSPNIQIQSQNLPKGIALEPRRTPFQSETKKPELKHGTHQPAYPKKIPSPTRKHFPAERNTWNRQKILPPLKEDYGRQDENLRHPSYGSRGNIFYHEYTNPYHNEKSQYIKSNPWDKSSPSTMMRPENPQYTMTSLDQKETEQYNEEDPIDPNEDESFPGQSRWGDEEMNFKGNPTVRQYEGEHYASTLAKEYLPYSLSNPPKPSEDFPYSEFYPWNPQETFPIYNPGPTIAPPVDPRSYYVNNAIGQEESTLFPSWTSWDHRNQAERQKESEPYFNRNVWDQSINLHKSNIPNHPYSTTSPARFPKDPTWFEGENLNYDLQITSLSPPEREQLAFPDFLPQSYPTGQNEAHLFHQSQRGSCCIGGSTGHKDNVLALQDYTSSYGLPPRKNQETSPVHTESSYIKYARPNVSPASILPSQRNISENKLTAESPNPSPFGDGVPTVRKNTPYSGKNQLETGIVAFSEASSSQPKNTPCLKSDLGGDRRDVLKQFFEGSQLSERTAGLTPEQLVIGIPDKGSGPDSIQSEVQGKEGEMQQQRPPTIMKLPCFGSNSKFHSSTTGPPINNRRPTLLNGALSTPTESPNTLVGLATREQLKSINVDKLNADEHTTLESFQGTSPQDQGCLLLQA
ncbi:enamelin precursor [Mus musculus]|uniref:Enamelin n=3 Tax=Mus musculus TaxID=10090 RepID=ENAM_MOUSE|nr:enamelin precursor [Mus musculus]O55196.1 RecName: Full=Enamelin; Flags: Precursor [Mus musculus]AAB94312.1 enamelin [Mus musculus]AAI15849.1 Enamelin [Mus musculus]AAK62271.1 enamelin [Mus musculus]|eukprot:NP_059496.1 enamelin precursor [Mus musculus]